MTEPLDLAALERINEDGHGYNHRQVVRDLIEELRDTRATAQTLAERCIKAEGDLDGAIDECATWADRAERAEAAIARVEVLLDLDLAYLDPATLKWYIRRAIAAVDGYDALDGTE